MLITTVVVGPGLVARMVIRSGLSRPGYGTRSPGRSVGLISRGDVRPEVGYSPTLMYADLITKLSSHVKGWRWTC